MRRAARPVLTEDQRRRAAIADELFELHNRVNVIIGGSVEKIMTGDSPKRVLHDLTISILAATTDAAEKALL